ncbi:hypothetical protein EMCRGX_G024104 [Ephydatia muelleri]
MNGIALRPINQRTWSNVPHQSIPPYASPFRLCTYTHTPWLCQLWSSEPEDMGLTSPPLPMPVNCVHTPHTLALSTLIIRTRGPKVIPLTSPALPMPVHSTCVHTPTHHGFVNFGHQNQRI